MDIQFSIIEHTHDNKPILLECTWNDFIDVLQDFSKIERHPSQKLTSTPAIMPAIFDNGFGKRNVDCATHISSWAAVDIDSDIAINDMRKCYAGNCFDGCIYSTTSHTNQNHKLRGIFKLNRDVMKCEYKEFWAAIDSLFGNALDPATKDISRIYYVPARWSNDACFERIAGMPLDVDGVLDAYRKTHVAGPVGPSYEAVDAATDKEISLMLEAIASRGRPSFELWRAVAWAVRNETANAEALLKSIFPEERPGEYAKLFKSFSTTRSPTIRSLAWYAKQVDPDIFKKLYAMKLSNMTPAERLISVNRFKQAKTKSIVTNNNKF